MRWSMVLSILLAKIIKTSIIICHFINLNINKLINLAHPCCCSMSSLMILGLRLSWNSTVNSMTHYGCSIGLHFSNLLLLTCFITQLIPLPQTYCLLHAAFAKFHFPTRFLEEVLGYKLAAKAKCPFFYRYYL